MLFKQRLIWEDAKAHCGKYGSKLASVRNKEHLSYLASISDPRGTWLGAMKIRLKNRFKWENEDVEALDGNSDYWASPGEQSGCSQNSTVISQLFANNPLLAVLWI